MAALAIAAADLPDRYLAESKLAVGCERAGRGRNGYDALAPGAGLLPSAVIAGMLVLVVLFGVAFSGDVTGNAAIAASGPTQRA